MNNKVSKSQIEVWEWKENLYEEIKNIPKGKKLDYLNKKHKESIESFFNISFPLFKKDEGKGLYTVADSD